VHPSLRQLCPGESAAVTKKRGRPATPLANAECLADLWDAATDEAWDRRPKRAKRRVYGKLAELVKAADLTPAQQSVWLTIALTEADPRFFSRVHPRTLTVTHVAQLAGTSRPYVSRLLKEAGVKIAAALARKDITAPPPAIDYAEACRLLSVDFTTLADDLDPDDENEDRHPDPLAGRTDEGTFDPDSEPEAI
jgi:hypothetical protein